MTALPSTPQTHLGRHHRGSHIEQRWDTRQDDVLKTTLPWTPARPKSTRKTQHDLLLVQGEAVEHVDNIRSTPFPSWPGLWTPPAWWARPNRGFSYRLKQAGLSSQVLGNFYKATIESILCLSASVWYGRCTAQDKKDLAWVVKIAIVDWNRSLPDMDSLCEGQVQRQTRRIAADPTHPGNGLFVPLPSRNKYRRYTTLQNTNKQNETTSSVGLWDLFTTSALSPKINCFSISNHNREISDQNVIDTLSAVQQVSHSLCNNSVFHSPLIHRGGRVSRLLYNPICSQYAGASIMNWIWITWVSHPACITN